MIFCPRDILWRVFSRPSRTIILARSGGEIRDGDKDEMVGEASSARDRVTKRR